MEKRRHMENRDMENADMPVLVTKIDNIKKQLISAIWAF